MVATSGPGTQKAWDLLEALKTEDVCKAAAVNYDTASDHYVVRSFERDILVSLKSRTVSSAASGSDGLYIEYAELFPPAILRYLALAKDIAATGRLVHLEDLRGGDIFAKGSHVLPLEKVAQRYGNDREGFLKKGLDHGGVAVPLADGAVRLSPLPRVPVTVTLWLADEEFPARAGLFFDSTCGLQLPTDILWSLARISCLTLL